MLIASSGVDLPQGSLYRGKRLSNCIEVLQSDDSGRRLAVNVRQILLKSLYDCETYNNKNKQVGTHFMAHIINKYI